MADHSRPMEELLQIPTIGIEDAIVVPAVLANEFELKIKLLDFIRSAETWFENKPPNSIITWDDLVSKFLNRFYPHSKTRNIINEIINFQQVFGETFTEAWERFKSLLRKCPHHGFSLLHQIDFFYNGLSQADQDSLNSAAGGNLMTRNTQEAFITIENKAKVRTCRNKPQVSSSGGTSTQIDAITTLTKQVEALEYHIASMRETYDQNQEAAIQLMQNQVEEKSSGSTTSQFDHSLPEYKSFYFDLSIDPLHPAERSDSHHEEFADELVHIMSPPNFDPFSEIPSGESTVHIEVLSVLWGNRLPIPDGSLPLSR
ncbi:reverse transcriptase domain-containing protein [Tanacetum coccineum]